MWILGKEFKKDIKEIKEDQSQDKWNDQFQKRNGKFEHSHFLYEIYIGNSKKQNIYTVEAIKKYKGQSSKANSIKQR